MENFKKDNIYALLDAAQSGDEAAKAKIVEENMGLVLSVAKRFYNRGYDKDDINQLGAMGLVRSIENFDLSQNVRFSTYAVPVIMGEIKRFLRDDGPLKVSRSIKQTASRIAHFIEHEQKTKGTAPGVEDIAASLQIKVEDVLNALEATSTPESIFTPANDSDLCLADILCSASVESEILTTIDIKTALSSLESRDRNIVIMRYFMDKTQAEVAKKIGVSQVQISRLEKKILKKLRDNLACEN